MNVNLTVGYMSLFYCLCGLDVQGIRGADVGSVNTWPSTVPSAHQHRSATVRSQRRSAGSPGHLPRWNV